MFEALDAVGFNLHAVFDLDALPEPVRGDLRNHHDPERRYRQLILIGHGGRALWDAVQAACMASSDPIDDFSVREAAAWFAALCPGRRHQIIYPGTAPVGLQALGRLAGWHHDSPLRIGINNRWGTWFAYRVAMLADSELPPTSSMQTRSPCVACGDAPCIAACPAAAVSREAYALDKCIAFRLQPDSPCATRCLARSACPAGAEHRYGDEQIHHTYAISLKLIEALQD